MQSSQPNKHIHLVSTFSEFIHFEFKDHINAIGWHRQLQGNFQEIVNKLLLKENVTEVSVDDLQALDLSQSGEIARKIIIEDLHSLTEYGASPALNLIQYYDRDEEFNFISADVYSFHVDRSPIEADTILCTYYGASSDIVPNHQVEQKALIPEIRAQLLALYDSNEDDFDKFLSEYFFDLHYQPLENAQPFNLGIGHIWRLAVDHPHQKVLPCVHRAPIENGEYRLLLIC